MKSKSIVITLVLVLLAVGGGFYGGTVYQKSQNPARGANRTGGRFGAFAQNADLNSRAVSGQIISVDSGSVTVKAQDGSSKIVILARSTKFTKPTDASSSDLQTGERVLVIGKQNSDGSVTAENVQVNLGPSTSPTSTK